GYVFGVTDRAMVSAHSARSTPIRSETQRGKETASARVAPTIIVNVKSLDLTPQSPLRAKHAVRSHLRKHSPVGVQGWQVTSTGIFFELLPSHAYGPCEVSLTF